MKTSKEAIPISVLVQLNKTIIFFGSNSAYFGNKIGSNYASKIISNMPQCFVIISLARTPEIGQGLGRILSCGARKPEQT